jgi:MFS family permease
MFDLALLRDIRFSAASAGITVCFFAMFGVMFLLAQYLQMVLGYSPFHAGLLMLPMPLTMMVVAPQAPKLVDRFGITRVVPAGMSSIVIGLCVLSLLGPDTPVGAMYVALLPMMIGMAVTMSPFTTMIMTSVPPARAGMGSATNDTTRELGGALGVAVLGSVVTTQFKAASITGIDALPTDVQAEAQSGLPGAIQAARSVPTELGQRLVDDAQRAFTNGLGTAALVAAGVIALCAVAITFVLVRRDAPVVPRTAQPEPNVVDAPAGELGELQLPG